MVDFVSSNTAIDAYHKGVKRGDDRLAQLTRQERDLLENAKRAALLPTEIETARSANRLGRVRAETAEQTQKYDVQNAANSARTNSASADVAEGTVAPRISQAQSSATVAEAGAKYADDNASLTNRLSRVRAESAEEEAATKGFHKSLDLYLDGQYAAGDEVLARYGEPPLPDDLKTNVQTLRQIKTIADEARLMFPYNPAAQQQHIEAKIATIGQGANLTDPAFPHTLSEDGPTPPTSTLGGKVTANDRKIRMIIDAYKEQGIPESEAVLYATGQRKMPSNIDMMKLATSIAKGKVGGQFSYSSEEFSQIVQEEFNKLRMDNSFGAAEANRSSAPGASPFPDHPEARQAKDGNWYVPDPARPGKYLKVTP